MLAQFFQVSIHPCHPLWAEIMQSLLRLEQQKQQKDFLKSISNSQIILSRKDKYVHTLP